MELGNKLHPYHENPLDRVSLKLASKISPWFHRVGATPNMITTLSVIASILAVWNIYTGGSRIMFVIWACLSYFFDCLDGHFARRYEMCTKFGDYYDHLSDWGYMIAIFYVAFMIRGIKRQWLPYKTWIYGVLIAAGIASIIHMGLQEALYNSDESPTLQMFGKLAKTICGNPSDCIRATRWVGMGTFITVMIVVIAITVK